MEWSRERTLSLINEYKKRRGLWDMTHDDYRKKDVKQKLLLEVSASLGGDIPIVEVEKKFHTLRTQYHREINRMKRKEPYNSKWFGFDKLQFLSSPKACRSGKGRIKSEITEDGTVTTKYIIRETTSQNSGGPQNSSNNISEEFVTIQRKPTVTYELGNVSMCRSRELEKLIEETTKDTEEDAKPKMTIKEITVPLEDHGYSSPQLQTNIKSNSGTGGDGDEADTMNNQGGESMEEDSEPIETIDIHAAEDEIVYNTTIHIENSTDNHNSALDHAHHQPLPHTRTIKIQRRDTAHEDEYSYDEEQQQAHNIHAMPTKRIYYEANGHHQHTATIVATPLTTQHTTTQTNANSTLLNAIAKGQHQLQSPQQLQQNRSNNVITQLQQQTPSSSAGQVRDEFSTYGEYVANEMREITNREILVALKHKINTALFEASMAELQK